MIEILSPTSEFIRVDFPTFGFPTMFTNPALCILFIINSLFQFKSASVKGINSCKDTTKKNGVQYCIRHHSNILSIDYNMFILFLFCVTPFKIH